MRIILDTSAFWSRMALEMLAKRDGPVIVPTIVVAERCRQRRRDADAPSSEFLAFLAELGCTVEALGTEEALRFTEHMGDDQRWKSLARDALIAGHVRPGDELWTSNSDDFIAVGVPKAQIRQV